MFLGNFFCLISAVLHLAFLASTSAGTVDYKNLKNAKGDKLSDFSFCGYHASEASLPSLSRAATKTLGPGSGDQSTAIQDALDEVYASGGGVVVLKAGTYTLGSGLLIRNQTTLRGSGIGNTVLAVRSLSENVITMGNQSSGGKTIKTALITDDYVPAGTGTVHVNDTSGFAVGQHVFIQRAPSEMGVENLSIKVSPTCSGRILSDTSCTSGAVWVSQWTTDSWIRKLDLTGFNNFMTVGSNASRITIDSVTMNRDGATDKGAGYALDITISGTQVLATNCQTLGEEDSRSYSVGTQTLTPGPNAVLNYYAEQAVESIEPHQRWGHGFLVENSTTASVLLRNRATYGSGHGWAINQGKFILAPNDPRLSFSFTSFF
ncbi:hypothetical protein GQ44DRAFT_617679 [Phaeosphaeriaceae sp. PMI808]|nr:hypothetical protein GQ44DRAFT_617679 [Phaeosphaeriaceae sp. PMI808]